MARQIHRIFNPAAPASVLHILFVFGMAALVMACSPSPEKTARLPDDMTNSADTQTEIVILGTIQGNHRTSDKYSLDRLRTIVRDIDPDMVLMDIAPEQLEAAIKSYDARGQRGEEGSIARPEYTNVIISLQKELGYRLVGISDTSAQNAAKRNAILDAISKDPARKPQWDAHLKAQKRSATP